MRYCGWPRRSTAEKGDDFASSHDRPEARQGIVLTKTSALEGLSMSALGQKQTLLSATGMSALCQKRTHAPQQTAAYSITSSARLRIGSGTLIPSALAAFRLMMRFTFVAC